MLRSEIYQCKTFVAEMGSQYKDPSPVNENPNVTPQRFKQLMDSLKYKSYDVKSCNMSLLSDLAQLRLLRNTMAQALSECAGSPVPLQVLASKPIVFTTPVSPISRMLLSAMKKLVERLLPEITDKPLRTPASSESVPDPILNELLSKMNITVGKLLNSATEPAPTVAKEPLPTSLQSTLKQVKPELSCEFGLPSKCEAQPGPTRPAQGDAALGDKHQKMSEKKVSPELIKLANDIQNELYQFKLKARDIEAKIQKNIDVVNSNKDSVNRDKIQKEISMKYLQNALFILEPELTAIKFDLAKSRLLHQHSVPIKSIIPKQKITCAIFWFMSSVKSHFMRERVLIEKTAQALSEPNKNENHCSKPPPAPNTKLSKLLSEMNIMVRKLLPETVNLDTEPTINITKEPLSTAPQSARPNADQSTQKQVKPEPNCEFGLPSECEAQPGPTRPPQGDAALGDKHEKMSEKKVGPELIKLANDIQNELHQFKLKAREIEAERQKDIDAANSNIDLLIREKVQKERTSQCLLHALLALKSKMTKAKSDVAISRLEYEPSNTTMILNEKLDLISSQLQISFCNILSFYIYYVRSHLRLEKLLIKTIALYDQPHADFFNNHTKTPNVSEPSVELSTPKAQSSPSDKSQLAPGEANKQTQRYMEPSTSKAQSPPSDNIKPTLGEASKQTPKPMDPSTSKAPSPPSDNIKPTPGEASKQFEKPMDPSTSKAPSPPSDNIKPTPGEASKQFEKPMEPSTSRAQAPPSDNIKLTPGEASKPTQKPKEPSTSRAQSPPSDNFKPTPGEASKPTQGYVAPVSENPSRSGQRETCSEFEPPKQTSKEQTLDREQQLKTLADEKIKAGQQLYKFAKYREAFEMFNEACDLCPASSLCLSKRADVLMMLGEHKRALKDAQIAVALEPNTCEAGYVIIAKCCFKLGDIEGSEEAVKNAIVLFGEASVRDERKAVDELRFKQEEARDLIQRKLYYIARTRIESCLQLSPDCYETQLIKAECLAVDKQIDDASKIAHRIMPHLNDILLQGVYYVLGLCSYHQGKNEEAIKWFQKIDKPNRYQMKAKEFFDEAKRRAVFRKKERGNKAFESGKLQEALDLYIEALDIDIDDKEMNATLHYNKATVYAKLNRTREAEQACTLALGLKPDHMKALKRRALCCTELGEREDALDDYCALLQLYKQHNLADSAIQEVKRLLRQAKKVLEEFKRVDYFYKILGVDYHAHKNVVRKCYMAKLIYYHPDKHRAAGQAVIDRENRRAQRVSEAFTVLGDPVQRASYDSTQNRSYRFTNDKNSSSSDEDDVRRPKMPGFYFTPLTPLKRFNFDF